MSDLAVITGVHEAKRGAAELLARAATRLQGEGCELEMFREARADIVSAKIALQQCERAMEAMVRVQRVDWRKIIAESNSGDGCAVKESDGRGAARPYQGGEA